MSKPTMNVSVAFATTNPGKFKEAKFILRKHGITVNQLPHKNREIQSDSPGVIAEDSATSLGDESYESIIVEDSSLSIHCLKGFPGTYASYVYRTIGIQGILRLMQGIRNREATFTSAVAFTSKSTRTHVFLGEVTGEISYEPKGKGGFGYDPIFIPRGFTKCFAEMSLREKCSCSHRRLALEKFAEWFRGLNRFK